MKPADLARDELYAYVEYPKAWLALHEQPKPICVELVTPNFDGAVVRRVDGRSWVNETPAGGVHEQRRFARPEQLVSTWGDLIAAMVEHEREQGEREQHDERARLQQREIAEDAASYFAKLPATSTEFEDLKDKLEWYLLHDRGRTVTLDLDEVVAIARRLKELQEIVSQNALLALPEED